MKALVIADADELHWRGIAETIDVVIACGDVADSYVFEASRACACSNIVAVKGNHDSPQSFPSPIRDLHLKTVTVSGMIFGGFGGSWKYKPREHHLFEQDEVTQRLSDFPAVDIFVAHNSPRGINCRDDDFHQGFDAFVGYIRRCQPRMFLHGHQHINAETLAGTTRVIGVYGSRVVELG